MGKPITKTLQATLATPTAHKERKLRALLETYRTALRDAFDANCCSMSAVNDIVTPFELPYQAKDALKRYVPQLSDAKQLDENHPVRLVNRAATFDYNENREFSICWEVPQAGRGTNFWIPLSINPEHRSLWLDLISGKAEPGELRLLRNRSGWMLQATVIFEKEVPSYEESLTPIGIDIGESLLAAGCALVGGIPTSPILESGGKLRRLRKELYTTLKRFQQRNVEDWRIDVAKRHYRRASRDIIEKISRAVIDYASGFENPIVVLEELTHIRDRISFGDRMNRRLHTWAFRQLQVRIEDKATEAAIPVKFVEPAYTSRACHECRRIGSRPSQGTFRCRNDRCRISSFQADINAAINIAHRHDPWGETCRLENDRDDSPRDGSRRDTAAA